METNMFEIVIVSVTRSLHTFKARSLKEALQVQHVYLMMGLSARIWSCG